MIRYLKDQRGLEVLEWVLVGAALTATILYVFGPVGNIRVGLNDATYLLRLMLVGTATP